MIEEDVKKMKLAHQSMSPQWGWSNPTTEPKGDSTGVAPQWGWSNPTTEPKDVIRTKIEEDVKKMNLAHQISTKHGKGSVLSHHWLMMAAAAMVVMAVFALWMNRRGSYSKIVDPVETEPLVATYGH